MWIIFKPDRSFITQLSFQFFNDHWNRQKRVVRSWFKLDSLCLSPFLLHETINLHDWRAWSMHFYIYATVDTTNIREIVQQNKDTVSKNMLKELFVFWFKFTWEVIKQTPSSMYGCGEGNQWEKKKKLPLQLTFSLLLFFLQMDKPHVLSIVKLWGGKQKVRLHPAEIIWKSAKRDSPGKGFSKECS